MRRSVGRRGHRNGRADKLLKELRAELKHPPAQPSNEGAIERALEACIIAVRKLNASDQVFLSRDTLEAFRDAFESMPSQFMDDEKRSLLKAVKDVLDE